MEKEKILEVKNLDIAYGGFPSVSEINFSLHKGEVLALVGESGSGKTTVIRSIMGLLPPGGKVTAGTILLNGKDLQALTKDEWCSIRGPEIAMIFQDSGSALDPIQKIGKQFRKYFQTHEKISDADCDEKAIALLESVALKNCQDLLERYPYELSGGQRQRLGVAMGLALEPQLLLADEPTSALDVTTQSQVVLEMMELARAKGTAIIIVTHNLGVASYMADYILVMQNGKVVDEGHPKELLERPNHPYTKKLISAVPKLEGVRYVES